MRRRHRRGHSLRRRYGRARSGAKARYHYSIWGRAPGWGYESGWTFGVTPEDAVANALTDARQFGGAHKWKLPGNVYLKPDSGDTLSFYVYADGRVTPGQGPR